jgi:predicted aldo/keto reductase-like oxidoreductase
MSLTRRKFLETTAAGAIATGAFAAKSDSAMPTRPLGKTGAHVSILAIGTGSRYLKFEEDQAIEAIHKGLDQGVTYIDSADDYGKDRRSELLVGKAIKGRRNGVFIATKLSNRDPEQSFRIVETSLKSLQIDRLDLLHIHGLMNQDDLDKIEAKGGVLDQVLKMRDQKMTRFIGITCHNDPTILAAALERHDFDVTQMALNAALVGMKNGKGGMVPNDAIKTSFESVALPVANRKKMGVIAMKVMAQDALIGPAEPSKLISYALSLPITAVVIGMSKFDQIDENCRVAKAFKPMPASERKQLSEELSKKYKAQLDHFFMHHIDA